MDRLEKMNAEAFAARMRVEFEAVMQKVAEVVNSAAEGHLIEGSEEQVRDLLGEFRRKAYQTAVQMRVEATESSAAFSPSAAAAGKARDGGTVGAELQRAGGTEAGALRAGRRRQRRSGG